MNPRIPVASDDLLHPSAKDLLSQVELPVMEAAR